MAQHKLTAQQMQRVEQIREFERAVDAVAKLVAELDHSRAGATRVIQELCGKIAKHASHIRQRALAADLGTLADLAGTMSIMAGRGIGMNVKLRALGDGVNSMKVELDQAMRAATEPREPEAPDDPGAPRAPSPP